MEDVWTAQYAGVVSDREKQVLNYLKNDGPKDIWEIRTHFKTTYIKVRTVISGMTRAKLIECKFDRATRSRRYKIKG